SRHCHREKLNLSACIVPRLTPLFAPLRAQPATTNSGRHYFYSSSPFHFPVCLCNVP
ncbi:hypothetical protein S83_031040, partial [Arachis hypogaea]